MDNLQDIIEYVRQSSVVWYFSDIYGIVLGLGNYIGYTTTKKNLQITASFNNSHYALLTGLEKEKFKKFLETEYSIKINKVVIYHLKNCL